MQLGAFIKRVGNKLAQRYVIKGYKEYCIASNPKRALLSYLVLPLLPPRRMRDRKRFTNRGMAQEIARALNEMGYILDIVNMNNEKWRPKRKYDLFIGHGGQNYEAISKELPASTIKIYFSTGIYWKEFNRREAMRFMDLATRKGYFLPPDRAITYSEEYAVRTANGIIALSGDDGLKTYSKFPFTIGIRSAVFPISNKDVSGKDYNLARRHYLFFSGDGNVHKGLDLLIEAFARTDLHLHICQRVTPAFKQVYQDELNQRPNIHLYGFLEMRSPQYEVLVGRCNWVISATCGEGIPGSILECMAHGLIPVLPDSANIELADWGIRIPGCTVENIMKVVLEASEMPTEECKRRATLVVEAIKKEFSVEGFNFSFREAVARIISEYSRNYSKC